MRKKVCKRCEIPMNYFRPSDGGYYICKKCSKVEIPLDEDTFPNLGNTFLIDKEYDKENNLV